MRDMDSDDSDCDAMHDGFHEIPLHSELSRPLGLGTYLEPPELVTAAKNQTHLYSIIAAISNALMHKVGTEKFLDDVISRGSMALHWHEGNDDTEPVNVMEISEHLVRSPFLVAEKLIDVMRQVRFGSMFFFSKDGEQFNVLSLPQWYSHQERCDAETRLRFAAFVQLSDLLGEIQDCPTARCFRKLYHALQNQFPVPDGQHLMTSNYALFYYWLYFEPYVQFISNGILSIIGTAGEGTQSVVFRVCAKSDILSQQSDTNHTKQVMALKIYKKYHDRDICLKEERIMEMATRFNAMYKDLGLESKWRLHVPALIESSNHVNGLSINCHRHGALLSPSR